MQSSGLPAVVRRSAHLIAVSAPGLGGRGVQFLVLAALAGVLAPAEYGRFVVLQTLVVGTASVLGSTAGVTFNTAAARLARAGSVDRTAVLLTLLRSRRRAFLVNVLVSSLVLVMGSPFLTGRMWPSGPAEAVPLLLIGTASAALPIGEGVVAVLAGTGRPLAAACVDAARAVVAAVAAFAGGVAAGAVGAAAGLVVADVVLVVVLGVLVGVRRARPTSVLGRSSTAGGGPTPTVVAPARDGLAAGVTANVLGQVASWIVLWAVQVVGGPVGLGVYGVATRFASVVTLAPVFLGKTVVGQLAVPGPGRDRWTPGSFVGVLAVLSVVGSAVSVTVLLLGFPDLLVRYPGLLPVTMSVLLAASVRAILIGVGNVCVARRHWRTWVTADAVGVVVVVGGVLLVLATGGGVVAVVSASAAGFAAGVAVRAVSLLRTPGGSAR
ncbi:hypothetical protein [Curtobacterium sp. RRHDQ10]|uniref:hypothetical protein n=1 Tax=Curtobacterium phyllosphaerae TaxID=3413379 RepID=UPI003BF30D48